MIIKIIGWTDDNFNVDEKIWCLFQADRFLNLLQFPGNDSFDKGENGLCLYQLL